MDDDEQHPDDWWASLSGHRKRQIMAWISDGRSRRQDPETDLGMSPLIDTDGKITT